MPKISESLKEEKRERILDAVVESLKTYGYAGTNMRTIAEAAGLTKGGLYAYFSSKEEILLEVARRYMEQQVRSFAPQPAESPLAQLARAFQTGAATLTATGGREVARAIMDLWFYASDLPAIRTALETRYDRYRREFAAMIRKGQSAGEIRPDVDAWELAALVLAARDGIAFHALVLRLPVSPMALNAQFFAVLKPYLIKEE